MKSRIPRTIVIERGDKGYRIKVFERTLSEHPEMFYSDKDVETFREDATKLLLELCDKKIDTKESNNE
jgi:hypothetical protein